MTVILASASRIRAQLLRSAGFACESRSAAVDEAALKVAAAHLPVADVALALARAKALAVSADAPEALVIGADQILALGDRRFDKPENMAAARAQLQALRGKTHELISAVACARGSELLWSNVSTAHLTMRAFSDGFLDSYIEAQGYDLLTSVGAYKLESRGIQLFERIDGDYFTILGLPLLPLLGFLRDQGVVPA